LVSAEASAPEAPDLVVWFCDDAPEDDPPPRTFAVAATPSNSETDLPDDSLGAVDARSLEYSSTSAAESFVRGVESGVEKFGIPREGTVAPAAGLPADAEAAFDAAFAAFAFFVAFARAGLGASSEEARDTSRGAWRGAKFSETV